MHFRTKSAFAVGLLLVVGGLAIATAEAAAPIDLTFGKPQPGKVFKCAINVEVKFDDEQKLEQFATTAGAYSGHRILGSSGLRKDRHFVVRTQLPQSTGYLTVPLVFAFSEKECDKMNAVGIVFARCTFGEGPAVDCLDRLRLHPPANSSIRYFVEENAGSGE